METSDEMRLIVYAPDPQHSKWIESELADVSAIVQTARTVAELVSALIDTPPPRPQLVIADIDAMNAGELLHLHSVREQGWFGDMIAIGSVPMVLRRSLGIERVVTRPARDKLRALVTLAKQHAVATRRMPKILG